MNVSFVKQICQILWSGHSGPGFGDFLELDVGCQCWRVMVDLWREVRAALVPGESAVWWGRFHHTLFISETDFTDSDSDSSKPFLDLSKMLLKVISVFEKKDSSDVPLNAFRHCRLVISAAFLAPTEIRSGLRHVVMLCHTSVTLSLLPSCAGTICTPKKWCKIHGFVKWLGATSQLSGV